MLLRNGEIPVTYAFCFMKGAMAATHRNAVFSANFTRRFSLFPNLRNSEVARMTLPRAAPTASNEVTLSNSPSFSQSMAATALMRLSSASSWCRSPLRAPCWSSSCNIELQIVVLQRRSTRRSKAELAHPGYPLTLLEHSQFRQSRHPTTATGLSIPLAEEAAILGFLLLVEVSSQLLPPDTSYQWSGSSVVDHVCIPCPANDTSPSLTLEFLRLVGAMIRGCSSKTTILEFCC